MPSEQWTVMGKLVLQIFNKPDAEPFREAVDWRNLGLVDYPEVVKKPMDLGQIKRKIEKEEYSSLHEAAEDVRLVWQNCKTYNADGSDFFILAENMSQIFENKYSKLLKELNITEPEKSVVTKAPSLEEKKLFAKSLYKITKEQLGKVIVDLDELSPQSITKNSAEDQVEINVDNIEATAFFKLMDYVSDCMKEGSGRKKKISSTNNKTKKARAS